MNCSHRRKSSFFVPFPLALWEYLEVAGFFSDSFLTFPPLPQLPALATPPPITLAASLGLFGLLYVPKHKSKDSILKRLAVHQKKKRKSSTARLHSFHTCCFSILLRWMNWSSSGLFGFLMTVKVELSQNNNQYSTNLKIYPA